MIIFPFYKYAKNKMVNCVHECVKDIFIKEIIECIVSYLFFSHLNVFDFYDEEFYKLNELEIKSFQLLNYIGGVSMKDEFKKIFSEKFNNIQFAKYIINNHCDMLITRFVMEKHSNLEYLYKLIKLYPLKIIDCYYLLFALIQQRGSRTYSDKYLIYLLKFLKHFESIYPTKFDINYKWNAADNDNYILEISDNQKMNYLEVDGINNIQIEMKLVTMELK